MNRDTVKKTARATSDWAVEGRREKPYDAVDHLVFPEAPDPNSLKLQLS